MDVDVFETFVYVILMRVFGFVGLVGNLVILYVLFRSALKESSYIYLTAMTVFDVCVNAFVLGIGFVRCKLCEFSTQQTSTVKIFEMFVFIPGINMAATASLWTVLAMAIERFIFVAYPLQGKKCCQRQTAKKVVAFICVASVALNAPRFFLDRPVTLKDGPAIVNHSVAENRTVEAFLNNISSRSHMDAQWKLIRCDVIETTKNPASMSNSMEAGLVSPQDYFLAVSVFEALSFASLVYFNVRLIRLLAKNNRSRRVIVASFRNETFAATRVRDEIRLSITLSAVVALAVFTSGCTLLASEPLGRLIYGADYKRKDVYRVFVLVGDMAVITSSSFNFVFYGIFNSRIKRECRRVYCSSSEDTSQWFEGRFCCKRRPIKESTKRIARRATVYSIDVT